MLNKTSIKRLKQKEKVYRLLDGDGLYLEVRTNGEKYWRYRYLKISGKSTMVSLGRYPNVSIEIARIERDQKKKHIEYGSVSFADVSKRWHESKTYASEKNKQLEIRWVKCSASAER